MKVKELINQLKQYKPTDNIVVSSDEELNAMFEGFQVAQLNGEERIVIYPLSGTEVEF